MTLKRARVIVLGNTKGGSGKSTVAMHLLVACLRRGRAVASVDADVGQRTLTRYLDNRRLHGARHGLALPMPDHHVAESSTINNRRAARIDEQERLMALMARLMAANDVVVVDTPGADTYLNRVCHVFADTLVTPLNDSFIDLDVLARPEGDEGRITAPSHYAEMVWDQKKKRAASRGAPLDWVVTRNRLSNLDARNKRAMAEVLDDLARRFGFRVVPGFGERVIYREMFPKGLTLLDLPQPGEDLQVAHVAARQEIRALLGAVGLP